MTTQTVTSRVEEPPARPDPGGRVVRMLAPRTEAWAPQSGTRWMETGSRATLLAIVIVAAFRLSGATDTGSPLLFWGLLAAGSLLVPLAPDALARRSSQWWLGYAWTGTGVVLLTLFVASRPGHPDVWLPLWGLLAINVAYALPLRGQVILQSLGALSLAAVLSVHGRPMTDLVLDVGLYAVIAALSYSLCRRLRESIAAARAARHEAELGTRLLSALVNLNELEPELIAKAAVTALNELGYEMATFGRVDVRQRTMVPLATAGFQDDSHRETVVPIDEGLAGEALRRGRTVTVSDYREFEGRLPGREEIRGAIAVPVLVNHRPEAVLLGARREPGQLSDEHLEVIEILAAQAGRALLVGSRFAAERETAERLGELDQLKSDFIASVTHELRTPLTVILGAGQTLTEPERADGGQRTLLLQRLQANADRLDQMIATLLDLSHLEAGVVEVRPVRLRLADVAAHVLDDLGTVGDRYVIEIDVQDVEVEADPVLLGRVLTVLVGNALEHTPEGTTIRLRAECLGAAVRVVLEDTGPGIRPEELPFVADRFFRGGPATRRSSSGLGLGLAVARRVLHEHGSDLVIENAPGSGARVTFELPAAIRPLPTAPPHTQPG